MSKILIIIKRNSLVFNGKEYFLSDLDEISRLLKTNLKIIILEEELYSKYFYEKIKKTRLKEFVDIKINKDFPDSSDILYDYEQSRIYNTIAIYSSKGGKRIEKISKNAKSLEVKPMQYIIKECIKKAIKNKVLDLKILDSKILVKFNDYYYYISFKNRLFYYGFVEKEIKIIIDRIIESDYQGEIYVDDSIDYDGYLKENFQVIKINIGELLNDQVYEKQRLYSKAIL